MAATGKPVAVDLRLPGKWANPDYQRVASVRKTWSEILPGLQCYLANPAEEDGGATIVLRLTPEGDAP